MPDSKFPGWFLAKLWAQRENRTQLDAAIERLIPKVRACDSNFGCAASSQLLGLLAISGRSDEAYVLIGQDKAEVLFNITPYPPFHEEVRYGEGRIKSIDLLVAHTKAKGEYLLLEGALEKCVYDRLSLKRIIALEAEPDFVGALHCARTLIEISDSNGSIKAHEARFAKTPEAMKTNYQHGRHKAAFTALRLANQMATVDDEISIDLENQALRLLKAAPERPAYGLFVPIAITRLEKEGRLQELNER